MPAKSLDGYAGNHIPKNLAVEMPEVNENLKNFKIIRQIGTMIYGWLSDKSRTIVLQISM